MNVRSVVLRARKMRLFIREKFNIPIDPKDKRFKPKISGSLTKKIPIFSVFNENFNQKRLKLF